MGTAATLVAGLVIPPDFVLGLIATDEKLRQVWRQMSRVEDAHQLIDSEGKLLRCSVYDWLWQNIRLHASEKTPQSS
jgi:hypothetical protein